MYWLRLSPAPPWQLEDLQPAEPTNCSPGLGATVICRVAAPALAILSMLKTIDKSQPLLVPRDRPLARPLETILRTGRELEHHLTLALGKILPSTSTDRYLCTAVERKSIMQKAVERFSVGQKGISSDFKKSSCLLDFSADLEPRS